MGKAIGLLELRSIPVGIEAADTMLKAANVELLEANPICPGKYSIIITGAVGAVRSAMESGSRIAGQYLVCRHAINNVHDTVPAAMRGRQKVDRVAAIGVIETQAALTAVQAADYAVKAANIQLMEVRVARLLGGKGFVIFTGEISAVRSALDSAIQQLQPDGKVTSSCVIPAPHPDLIDKLAK